MTLKWIDRYFAFILFLLFLYFVKCLSYNPKFLAFVSEILHDIYYEQLIEK